MSDTFMPKAANIERKRYVIDATGLPLGRLSAQVASILRGKVKPIFVPNVDCGDFVSVINCDKVLLTGRKLENKKRYRYTGYVGNLKTIDYSDLMAKNPCKAVELAVKGMVPNTVLGRKQMRRLSLQVGSDLKDAKKYTSWKSFRKVKVRVA
jgi:large subunit ribosomal protein L13